MVRGFLGSKALAEVAERHPVNAFDLGARSGVSRDLSALAFAVNAYGFEPDEAECRRLNQAAAAGPDPWRSLTYLPYALAGKAGQRTLFITERGGTSSLLEPVPGAGGKFSRPESYYKVVRKLEGVPCRTLDQAAKDLNLEHLDFLKIDVEGMEYEVLRGGELVLADQVLGLRIEAGFVRLRRGQRPFHEMDALLRDLGFQPMRFMELHHWRRLSPVKPPRPAPGLIPYSLGQMVHGDLLYLRSLGWVLARAEQDPAVAVRYALLAMAYQYVDWGCLALRHEPVRRHLDGPKAFDPDSECGLVSATLWKQHRLSQRREIWRSFKQYLKEGLKR